MPEKSERPERIALPSQITSPGGGLVMRGGLRPLIRAK